MSVLEDLSQHPQSLPGKPGFHRNRWTAEQSPSWRLCPHEGWLRNLTGRGGGLEHPPAAKPLVIQGGVTAAEHQSQELLPLQIRPSVGGSAHLRRNTPGSSTSGKEAVDKYFQTRNSVLTPRAR